MPHFSTQSIERLSTVDKRLQVLFSRVIIKFDCKILQGKRTAREQMQLFAAKKTKTLKSKHLEGLAIDVAPWPIDWEDLDRFRYFAGFVMGVAHELGINIRWGGDWNGDTMLSNRDSNQRFNDFVHFELIDGG